MPKPITTEATKLKLPANQEREAEAIKAEVAAQAAHLAAIRKHEHQVSRHAEHARSIEESRRDLSRLTDMEEPTPQSLANEAALNRKLTKLEAAHAQLTEELETAQAHVAELLDAASEKLSDRLALVKNLEADELAGELIAFESHFRARAKELQGSGHWVAEAANAVNPLARASELMKIYTGRY